MPNKILDWKFLVLCMFAWKRFLDKILFLNTYTGLWKDNEMLEYFKEFRRYSLLENFAMMTYSDNHII